MLQLNVEHKRNYTVTGNTDINILVTKDIDDGIIRHNAYITVGKFSPEFLQDTIALKDEELNEKIAEQIKQDIINFLNKGEI